MAKQTDSGLDDVSKSKYLEASEWARKLASAGLTPGMLRAVGRAGFDEAQKLFAERPSADNWATLETAMWRYQYTWGAR